MPNFHRFSSGSLIVASQWNDNHDLAGNMNISGKITTSSYDVPAGSVDDHIWVRTRHYKEGHTQTGGVITISAGSPTGSETILYTGSNFGTSAGGTNRMGITTEFVTFYVPTTGEKNNGFKVVWVGSPAGNFTYFELQVWGS